MIEGGRFDAIGEKFMRNKMYFFLFNLGTLKYSRTNKIK